MRIERRSGYGLQLLIKMDLAIVHLGKFEIVFIMVFDDSGKTNR